MTLFAKWDEFMVHESQGLVRDSPGSDEECYNSYESTTSRDRYQHEKKKPSISGDDLDNVEDVSHSDVPAPNIKTYIFIGAFFFLFSFSSIAFYNSGDVVGSVRNISIIEAAQQELPVMVGQEMFGLITSNHLLSGFKIDTQESEGPFKARVFDCDVVHKPFAQDVTHYQIVTSKESLAETMSISGDLSVSYGPMSGNGAGSFLNSVMSSKHRVVVEYYSRRSAYVEECRSGLFNTTAVVDDYLNNGKTDEIYDKLGTKYIEQILFGQQISVRYEVTSESELNTQEISAQLGGKIGVGALAVSFQGKFDSTKTAKKDLYNLSIKVRIIGSTVPVPPGNSFEQVNKFITEVNEDYQRILDLIRKNGIDGNEVVDQLTAISFTLGDTSKHIPTLDVNEAATLSAKIKDLSKTWQDVLFTQARLSQEDTRLDQKFPSGRDRNNIYFKWVQGKESVERNLNDKLQECITFRSNNVRDTIAKPVPTSISQRDVEIIDGLIGKGYIEAPVTLDEVVFPGMYWEGYVLSNNAFYLGNVFCDDGTPIDGPKSPKQLASSLDEDTCTTVNTVRPTHTPTESPTQTVVQYDDTVFLQNYDTLRQWMTGNRYGTYDVLTKNLLGSDYEVDLRSHYEWKVKRGPNNKEPRSCLQYGDMINLPLMSHPDLLLSGGRGATQENVYTYPKNHWSTTTEEWIVRSNPGEGFRYQLTTNDPLHGKCVKANSIVYLQCNSKDFRWLTGHRDGAGKDNVYTRNLTNDYEKQQAILKTYQWIIRVDHPGIGDLSHV